MYSRTEIANLAISHHAGDYVENIDAAPGRMAEAIRTHFDHELLSAMAKHLWKFGRKTWRDQGAVAPADNPDTARQYAFRLPSDCLRVFLLAPEFEFDEWPDTISTSAGNVVDMVGVRNDVPLGALMPWFVDYFAAKLAYRICTPVNASEAIRKRCRDEMQDGLAEAMTINGKVGVVRQPFADSFIAARYGAVAWRGTRS